MRNTFQFSGIAAVCTQAYFFRNSNQMPIAMNAINTQTNGTSNSSSISEPYACLRSSNVGHSGQLTTGVDASILQLPTAAVFGTTQITQAGITLTSPRTETPRL